MKLKVGDILIPPDHVRNQFEWWDKKSGFVVKKDVMGYLYVIALDGDTYYEGSLYNNGYTNTDSGQCFKLVRKPLLTENE